MVVVLGQGELGEQSTKTIISIYRFTRASVAFSLVAVRLASYLANHYNNLLQDQSCTWRPKAEINANQEALDSKQQKIRLIYACSTYS